MTHVSKFKNALKLMTLATLACFSMVMLSVTAVALADEITNASADQQSADFESTLNIQSEESRKKEFIDPHYQVHDAEAVEIEIIETETSLGRQIADFAYSFVGWLPYVWGGESLEYGADCCGFTQAVYSAFGIDIPRTVEEQACIGYPIRPEDAQPGDLIIYYGHVGLYAGDGMVIHSPCPGTCVTYETVYVQDILDIRRIL